MNGTKSRMYEPPSAAKMRRLYEELDRLREALAASEACNAKLEDKLRALDMTSDERIIIIDSLVTMLGIALSRSAALRHHSNIKQAEHFADQCSQIRKLIGKLEQAWPTVSAQTILKF